MSWHPVSLLVPFHGVEQNPRIPRLEFSEIVTATACVYFIPSSFSLVFDELHIVINSVYVQNLPTEQATSVATDFFRGAMTLHSRL